MGKQQRDTRILLKHHDLIRLRDLIRHGNYDSPAGIRRGWRGGLEVKRQGMSGQDPSKCVGMCLARTRRGEHCVVLTGGWIHSEPICSRGELSLCVFGLPSWSLVIWFNIRSRHQLQSTIDAMCAWLVFEQSWNNTSVCYCVYESLANSPEGKICYFKSMLIILLWLGLFPAPYKFCSGN